MVHNIENKATTERVILQLWGIDKKWVYHNGSWVDLATLPDSSTSKGNTTSLLEETTKRAWWKFW